MEAVHGQDVDKQMSLKHSHNKIKLINELQDLERDQERDQEYDFDACIDSLSDAENRLCETQDALAKLEFADPTDEKYMEAVEEANEVLKKYGAD
ncbi:hypothetical protein LCGC14_0427120 [marine sediment metagenome]|uniref:Uncharacterized protein n=1 Tax=marine sediment metagenome TaxID=412755 RepID=A0A0F9SP82_9ZZZZ